MRILNSWLQKGTLNTVGIPAELRLERFADFLFQKGFILIRLFNIFLFSVWIDFFAINLTWDRIYGGYHSLNLYSNFIDFTKNNLTHTT